MGGKLKKRIFILGIHCLIAITEYVYMYSIEMMLLNCGVGEDSWESLGLQGDPTSPF